MTANIQPPHVLLEGTIKFRDNKKWKARWAVVCKLSPVADCLHVNLYSSYNDKIRNVLPKRTIFLQSAAYLGIESGFTLQNESNTLAIVCRDATLVIALETREIMHQWQTKLQYQFCKGMGLHVLYSNQADEISKYFELASCGQLHSVSLQTSDCDGYYRKSSRESLLYKYANVGGSSIANGKSEVHKSNSSDSSSTCDSCSHVLSLTCDDTAHSCSRSSYYLNQADGGGEGSKCNIRAPLPPSLLAKLTSSIHCPLSIGEQFSSNHHLPPTQAATVAPSLPSPSDTLKAYSPSAVSLASQCTANFITSDRESIFSHSSQGSSSSSSGCSSLTCGADQSGSNGSSGSSSTTQHHPHNHPLHQWRSQVAPTTTVGYESTEVGNATALRHITVTVAADPVRQQNLDVADSSPSGVIFCQSTVRDGFIGGSGLSSKPNSTNDGSHCERSSETRQMANYDIPRNLCVNVAFSNQKATETVAGEAKPASASTAINHCYCDTASAAAVAQAVVQSTSAGGGGNSEQQRQQQTRDQCFCSAAGALNGDSIKHHELAATAAVVNGRSIFGRAACSQSNCAHSDSSTLIRRHTKPAHQQQQQHFLSAAVADNESSASAAHQCCISYQQKDTDQPQMNGCCGGGGSCGAAQWTIDSRVPGGCCGQKPAKHETVPQPNYANMQFINSIELYENLRFTQPALQQNQQHSNNSRINGDRINPGSDSNEQRHSIVGDESIISVASGKEKEESEKQSSNGVSSASPNRNCPASAADVDADAVPSCDIEKKCCTSTANCDEQWDSAMERNGEGGGEGGEGRCTRLNGNNSPTGLNSSTSNSTSTRISRERANNGGHYLRHHHHHWLEANYCWRLPLLSQ
ncbi:Protein Dok-7 [Tyrophagus putrescentiae]|nr:Protein Dok-7 [Tyrophagus putrescentiae]